tara:strand:- start:127 stop:300 length:174 start_codon:yes stop_codon:yes gene_type:complete
LFLDLRIESGPILPSNSWILLEVGESLKRDRPLEDRRGEEFIEVEAPPAWDGSTEPN